VAWLLLFDGTKVAVPYNKAATIYQILMGNSEIQPDKSGEYATDEDFKASEEYKKKAAFILRVKEVQFEDNKATKRPRPWEK
jgi:hypothetical protein